MAASAKITNIFASTPNACGLLFTPVRSSFTEATQAKKVAVKLRRPLNKRPNEPVLDLLDLCGTGKEERSEDGFFDLVDKEKTWFTTKV
jgi:hypothetical protein